MLSLTSTFIADNIPDAFGNPNSYTLYGDTDDDSLFYILPEFPNFLKMPSGQVAFSMLWYGGANVTEGGMLTFTLALQLPATSDPSVQKLLSDAVLSNPLVAARAQQIFTMAQDNARGDMAGAESGRNALGLSNDEAKKYFDRFDGTKDYTQFLPKGTAYFKAIEITSGSVLVEGFASEDYYTQSKDKGANTATVSGAFTVTPSFMNNNAAVVSMSLSAQGVNLLWHALGGPKPDNKVIKTYDDTAKNSVLAVTYVVTFDGMLPAASATVTLKKEQVVNYVKTVTKDTWGHSSTAISKTYKKTIDDAITINLPSSSYLNSDAGKTSIRDGLQTWAQAQLETMLQGQLPNVALDKLGDDGANKVDLNEIQDQSRTYKLSQAISVSKQPQVMLPTLKVLAPEADPHDYFRVLDLNDTPFVTVELPINAPSSSTMNTLGVASVLIGNIAYAGQVLRDSDGKEVTAVQYNATTAATPQQSLYGKFGKASLQNDLTTYSYVVSYNDGTPPLTQSVSQPASLNILPPSDYGVLRATLVGDGLPWGVLDRVQVDVQYADLYSTSVVLTEAVPHKDIIKPIGQLIDKPLQYKVSMFLKGGGAPLYYPIDGTSFLSQALKISKDVALKSGLGSGGVTYYSFELDDDKVKTVLMDVNYSMPIEDGNTREFTSQIRIERSAATSKTWVVPAPAQGSGSGTLTIKKARTTDMDGKNYTPTLKPIDKTATTVMIGLNEIPDY